MADRYVRRLVESWITANFATPYYPTVNTEQDPADPVWCTVDWGFSYPQRLTLCNDQLIDGTIQVAFLGPVGIGDDALLQAAEADMVLLMQQVDPNGKLELELQGAPEDFRQDRYYSVMFTVDYRYAR